MEDLKKDLKTTRISWIIYHAGKFPLEIIELLWGIKVRREKYPERNTPRITNDLRDDS